MCCHTDGSEPPSVSHEHRPGQLRCSALPLRWMVSSNGGLLRESTRPKYCRYVPTSSGHVAHHTTSRRRPTAAASASKVPSHRSPLGSGGDEFASGSMGPRQLHLCLALECGLLEVKSGPWLCYELHPLPLPWGHRWRTMLALPVLPPGAVLFLEVAVPFLCARVRQCL